MAELDSINKKFEVPERAPERREGAAEKMPSPEVKVERPPVAEVPAAKPSPPPRPPAPPVLKDEVLVKIENILEEDLQDIYFAMPEHRQRIFKNKGEKTAVKISILLHRAKVNIKKIVLLIREWLKLIPGVNHFFLEQESKIKADKIAEIKR